MSVKIPHLALLSAGHNIKLGKTISLKSTEGIFFNPICQTVTEGNNSSRLRWGIPLTELGQSGLEFYGYKEKNVFLDTPFSIGLLTHVNTFIEGQLLEVDFSVLFTDSNNERHGAMMNFHLYCAPADRYSSSSLEETPSDYLHISEYPSSQEVTFGDTSYKLKILGFGRDEKNIRDVFKSKKLQVNTTCIWVSFSELDERA